MSSSCLNCSRTSDTSRPQPFSKPRSPSRSPKSSQGACGHDGAAA
jgi:hypothetical protein